MTAKYFLTVNELAERIGVSRPHIYYLQKTGRLPPPIRLSARPLWDVATMDKWVCDLRAEAEAQKLAA